MNGNRVIWYLQAVENYISRKDRFVRIHFYFHYRCDLIRIRTPKTLLDPNPDPNHIATTSPLLLNSITKVELQELF